MNDITLDFGATAQKQAEEHRGQTAPKKSAPRRDER